jgi:hypothetical protein
MPVDLVNGRKHVYRGHIDIQFQDAFQGRTRRFDTELELV